MALGELASIHLAKVISDPSRGGVPTVRQLVVVSYFHLIWDLEVGGMELDDVGGAVDELDGVAPVSTYQTIISQQPGELAYLGSCCLLYIDMSVVLDLRRRDIEYRH